MILEQYIPTSQELHYMIKEVVGRIFFSIDPTNIDDNIIRKIRKNNL